MDRLAIPPAPNATACALRGEEANVSSALPTPPRIVLDIELDLLPFLEGVELPGRECGMVKEDLAAVVGTNKAESTVSDETNNRT